MIEASKHRSALIAWFGKKASQQNGQLHNNQCGQKRCDNDPADDNPARELSRYFGREPHEKENAKNDGPTYRKVRGFFDQAATQSERQVVWRLHEK